MTALSAPARLPAARPVTVITGASSGIGRELALLAAGEGEVVLVARGLAGLEELAGQIRASGGRAHVFACDGTESSAGSRLLAFLAGQGLVCDQLINNAGYGVVGLAHAVPAQEQIGSVDLNVRFLTELALAVLPGMLARRSGGILNVASVAGFLPGPGMAVYYASKAYVQSFSESLWQETKGTGVRITSLCPGPVNTGFLGRATAGQRTREQTLFHLDPSAVAQAGWGGFKTGELTVIPGRANRLAVAAARFLPRKLLLKLVMQRQSGRAAAGADHGTRDR